MGQPMTELSDADVFGNSAPGEMSDADVFGTPAKKNAVADVVGLTGRAGVQAVPSALLGLPGLMLDANDSAINLGKTLYNAAAPSINDAFGTNLQQSPLIPPWRHSAALSALGEKGADALGLPKPDGKFQQGATKIGSAALSALGGAGLARGLESGLQAAPEAVPAVESLFGNTQQAISNALPSLFNSLAQAPKVQAAGAAASTLAPDVAQNLGVKNPLALMALSLAGGAVPGAAATIGERGALGAAQAVRPFTTGGRESIVGKALNSIATNPTAAADSLANAQEIIPGSVPMVSQASRDPGMISAESALRGMDTNGVIPERYGQQNAARMGELDRIARDEPTLDAATAKRDSTIDSRMDPAFASNIIGADATPVLNTIEQIRNSRQGVRGIVQQAMDEAQSRVDGLLNSDRHDPTDPQNLYEVRKDLADLRDGKYNTDKSDFRLAKGQLQDVIDTLDNVIESGAPGYQDYLDLYRKRSIPLDQLKALQTVRSRAVLATTDPVTGQPVLSNAKFQTLLRNNLDNGLNLRGTGPGDGKLSDQQLATLDRIAADLDRGSAAQAGTIRSPGSDTFKNMSVASVIGRILGDDLGSSAMDSSAVKTIARPLNFLYRVPDQDIQRMMLQAWLDPQMASRLMRQASADNVRSVAADLAQRARANVVGSSVYSDNR